MNTLNCYLLFFFFFFRHVSKVGDQDEDVQTLELYKSVMKDGVFMLNKVDFNGKVFIYVSFLNYRTHKKHVDILLKLIEQHK